MIAQSLATVVIQRLARKLCQKCVRSEVPPPLLLESLVARGLAEPDSKAAMPRPVGCPACQNTGYEGRIAVFETLMPDDNLRNMLMAGMSLGDVEKAATETGRLIRFKRYAAFLMARNLLAPSEALLTVT